MAETETKKEPATTDDVLDFIIDTAKAKSHKLLNRETAKAIYEGIFALATRDVREVGYFKLPYGYGQFHLRVLGMGAVKPRKLPNGRYVERTPRPVMRYKQGATVQALLEGRTPAVQRKRSEKEINNLKRRPVP